MALPQHGAARILVFNESGVDAADVVSLLRGLGFFGAQALTNGRLLLPTLQAGSQFAAVVMDVREPEFNGLKNIYRIREHFSLAELPILSISESGHHEVFNAAMLAGANDHAERPLNVIQLSLRLRNTLAIAERQRASVKIQNKLGAQVAEHTSMLSLLIENGLLMSHSRDPDTLLRHTLFEGKRLLHCEGATLYLLTEHNTLCFAMRTLDDALPDEKIPLKDPSTGLPNERYASTWCALHKEPVHIDNVYTETRFDLSGTRRFDAATGQKTLSMLCVPLIVHGGQVLGVLQFFNKLDPLTGQVTVFPAEVLPLLQALAAQAAVTLDNLALTEAQFSL